MSIIRQLNLLGEEVNNRFPSINAGGCAIYAAIIIAALKKHGIPARAIVASHNAKPFNSAGIPLTEYATNIKNGTHEEWGGYGVDFAHVGVEFEINGVRKHYDSNGVTRAKSKLYIWPIYKGGIEYNILRKVVKDQAGWNKEFNRKDIPALRRLVKQYLAV